jgi:hypothetical protein
VNHGTPVFLDEKPKSILITRLDSQHHFGIAISFGAAQSEGSRRSV